MALEEKFIECQEFSVRFSVLFQGNARSTSLLEIGKESSGKRNIHLDTRLFYVVNLKNAKEVTMKRCPIDKMWKDCDTKQLVGSDLKLLGVQK